MSQMALMTGAPLAYREGQALTGAQRAVALAVAIGLHAAVIGGFVIAQVSKPAPPPERTLEVSFISEAQAAATPAPPQPIEPTPAPPTPTRSAAPQPTVMATPTPTPSPMSAPPIERVAPAAPQAPVAPPMPAPVAVAAQPAAAVAAAPASTPPSFKAAYLNNPSPVYPPGARMQRRQGTTRLRVQVSAEGAPMQVLLDRSSGHGDLDKSAMDVVRNRWKFAPATEAGRPVAGWVVVPLEFSITR